MACKLVICRGRALCAQHGKAGAGQSAVSFYGKPSARVAPMSIWGMGTAAEPSADLRKVTWAISLLAISSAYCCTRQTIIR